MDKSVAVCAILTGSSATPADARPPTCIGHFERDRDGRKSVPDAD
jgi:hypothetical protein